VAASGVTGGAALRFAGGAAVEGGERTRGACCGSWETRPLMAVEAVEAGGAEVVGVVPVTAIGVATSVRATGAGAAGGTVGAEAAACWGGGVGTRRG